MLKRQKKFRINYKIFIQYVPINEITDPIFRNSSKAIKNWICSCPSGRKIAGVCVHIATILYYLCYGKYVDLKSPAEYLNLALIDTNKNYPANKPDFVRNKRGLPAAESSSDESPTESEDEILLPTPQEQQKHNTDRKQYYKNQPKSKNKNQGLKPPQNQDILANNHEPNPDIIIKAFKSHIPIWGGIINYQGLKNIELTNTCTID